MKKTILFFLSLCFYAGARAQTPTFTKGETIAYLDKKIKEVNGFHRTAPLGEGQIPYYYYSSSVSLDGNKVTLYTERGTKSKKYFGDKVWVSGSGYWYLYPCDYGVQVHTVSFNPIHIQSISMGTSLVAGEPVGLIKITLKNSSAQQNYSGWAITQKINREPYVGKCSGYKQVANNNTAVSELYFTFFQADDTNFNKIKKALLHLQAVLSAEDDPFQ
jgi:hypothetical protein